jgi:hypothetical protein
MGLFSDLFGTLKDTFQLSLGGVKLKNVSVGLVVKAVDGTTDAPITASKVNISGEILEFNSDAAGSGADWKYTVQRPAAGMSEAVTLTLPDVHGSANQVLQTDGAGVLSWATAGTTAHLMATNSTSLVFGSSTPLALFTLPDGAVIHQIDLIIDTPWATGSAQVTVGIAGTTSKYMAASENDLYAAAKTVFSVHPGVVPPGGTEALIATYSASTADAGAGRIIIHYSVPE